MDQRSEDEVDESYAVTGIRVDEPHHIVRIDMKGHDGGTSTFSGDDEGLEVTAPSAGEIVDLADVG